MIFDYSLKSRCMHEREYMKCSAPVRKERNSGEIFANRTS